MPLWQFYLLSLKKPRKQMWELPSNSHWWQSSYGITVPPPRNKSVIPKVTKSHGPLKRCIFCTGKSAVLPSFRRSFACHHRPVAEKEPKAQGLTTGQNGVPEAVRGVPGRVPRGLALHRAPARLLSSAKYGPAGDVRQLVGSPAGTHQAVGETSR